MGSAPGFEDLVGDARPRAEQIVESVARQAEERARSFDFTTFRLGTRPVPGLDEGSEEHALLRAVIRVELRKRLERAWPCRRFDADRPDMIVEVRPCADGAGVWFEPQAAYVAGRYRKLSRGISQTVFHCRRCHGRGTRRGEPCGDCAGSGRGVAESVEDFVCPPVRDALGGRAAAFHGSGREDVDVRMLGEGRPFVVTVEGPLRRSLDAVTVAERITAASAGRVEVGELRIVDRDTKRVLTTEHGRKTYRVVVAPLGGVCLPGDAAARVGTLAGTTLAQRNPLRMQRRADIVRRRTVHALTVDEASGERLLLSVTTDPGLYVKEMVSGDGGRTTPSVAGLLGVPCVCSELDVVGVRPVDST